MKKYLILFGILIASNLAAFAQEDAIAKYFDKYLDDEKFTVVYITPKAFQMISKLDFKDSEANEVKNILQDLRGIRILTADTDGLKYYKEAISSFNTTDYDLLMTVKSKGDNVRFWTKESGGTISELLMLVGGKDEFVMMSFIGKIDLNKISRLANQAKIKGMEHLKEVEKH